MSGNAWSAFHYVPVRMALCSTVGVFHNFEAHEESEAVEEKKDDDGSENASSGSWERL
jgi:hypothetical protein